MTKPIKSFLSIFLLGIALPETTNAAAIVVPNFSFEQPDIAENTFPSGVDDWTLSGNGNGGIFDAGNDSFSGTDGDNAPLPGSADGGQSAYVSLDGTLSPAAEAHLTTNGSLATVEDNTTYSLTIALGRSFDYPPFETTIALLVNGFVAASSTIPVASMTPGTFADFSTSFVTGSTGDPLTGGSLAIRVSSSKPDGATAPEAFSSDFDNVRLDATTVPEASTTVLVAMGLLTGFLARRARPRAPASVEEQTENLPEFTLDRRGRPRTGME
jgi:hapalindole H/12-epi-hapalindole U/12-epi-fischerindole U synthase